MRLRKPNAPNTPLPPPAAPAAPATRGRFRVRWLAAVALVALVGAVGWWAWSEWRADPLRDVRAALDRRDFRAADELLVKRLTDHPDDRTARLLGARSARRGGNFARAFDQLQKYRETGGSDEASDLELALLRAQGGDAAEADRLFATYSARPESPETPFVMEAYLEGKLRVVAPRGGSHTSADAEEAALAAVEANARNLYRAIDLWLAARPGQADQVQGHLWRARTYFAANNHPEGVAALRRAVELDPEHVEARFQLALAVSLTDPDESRRHLEVLLARHPENQHVRFGLATNCRMLGRSKEARQLFEGLTDGPMRANALVELGQLDLDAGNVADAERRLNEALKLAPNSPEANSAMSRCQQLAGRPDEAAKYRKRFEEFEAERTKSRP